MNTHGMDSRGVMREWNEEYQVRSHSVALRSTTAP
jgi:hypothetical protein